ncbi:cell division protein FtsQ/DivIB [Spirochaeta thermophila]|uniref:Putative cell division protein FtsQ n=1 Tax=Winmispira thermophila (strain ATCC 49972 / DSM 6192 / RI 19.B1) TaxID=665571 RepID=E0RS57_WINT6|nr:FtsQ-type POTRA domain-containing protein [Spirochaeta thermophila]ADN01844.1 putative cell division protein FtsQ [Spirochaeta thermophila DSM 6192]
MADHMLYAEYLTPAKERGSRGRWIWWLLACSLLAGALYLVVQVVLLPRLRITRIILEGDLPASSEVILERAGLDVGHPILFTVRTEEIRRRLEAWPVVAHVEVEKVFPGTLRISLASRTPLVYLLVDRDGVLVPAVCDEEGVVFLAGKQVPAVDLPVLSGVRFSKFMVGARVPEAVRAFLKDVGELRKTSPRTLGLISEFRLVARGEYLFDIQVFFRGYRVPVRFEGHLTEEKVHYALMILDVLSKEGLLEGMSEVDFRGGRITYTKRSGV